jgi:nucleotidyltransferase substrate binding protein (TIGR01987 family)
MESLNNDTRWKQRFQNFRRAFNLLRSALEDRGIDDFSDLESEGVVQRFEYTFELGWNTFKDYLEDEGVKIRECTARKVIKECAARNIFNEANINPEIYLDMLLARNALSHIYDFGRFRAIISNIKNQYLSELEKEYTFFMNKELNEDA